MDLCSEVGAARKASGLSQQDLAERLGILRERIARLEAGTGSVELLVRVMSTIPMRLTGLAKGGTVVEQLTNCRSKRGWTISRLAAETCLDERTVRAVERGCGTVASLSKMLGVVVSLVMV